jgi:hypothetical protein
MALMAGVKKKRKRKMKLRDKTLKARERVLREARRRGVISNDRARTIGGWQQAYYHLREMVHAGMLKRAGYNQWMPADKRR